MKCLLDTRVETVPGNLIRAPLSPSATSPCLLPVKPGHKLLPASISLEKLLCRHGVGYLGRPWRPAPGSDWKDHLWVYRSKVQIYGGDALGVNSSGLVFVVVLRQGLP